MATERKRTCLFLCRRGPEDNPEDRKFEARSGICCLFAADDTPAALPDFFARSCLSNKGESHLWPTHTSRLKKYFRPKRRSADAETATAESRRHRATE